MARSLHGMLEDKRALLLAISHELRSPLTRARLNAELVDDGAVADALLRDLRLARAAAVAWAWACICAGRSRGRTAGRCSSAWPSRACACR
jgi:signal transduction histidine kinase